ncbi:MAG: radical SAM protein [Magnetococcales bacterium]|nr:radical SAM protein [Magnetococcales bacterium]
MQGASNAAQESGGVGRREPLTRHAAEQYLESRLGWPMATLMAFPRFFLIETINLCNARCIMCGIDFDDKKKIVMSSALFDKITEELAQHAGQVTKVMLYLDNEPLLDRRLHERVRLLKQAGIVCVNIATNGSILTKNRVTELIEAGLDEIYITLDSLHKATYESIRIGLEFERTYQGILTVIEQRNRMQSALRIRIQMILMAENHQEAETFLGHWKERLKPDDEIVLQKAHNWGNTVPVMTFGDEEQVNDIPCIALWGTMVIHADGQVGLCCVDTGRSHPLGDANRERIEDLWRSPVLEEIRALHLSCQRTRIPLCNRCTLWRDDKNSLQRLQSAHEPL